MDLSELEQNILREAREEFAEHGFHDTVVADIADRAGVGKGTVYRHFGTKSELFEALIIKFTRDLMVDITDTIERDVAPEQKLRNVLDDHFKLFNEARSLVAILVNEGYHRIMENSDRVVALWDEYNQLIQKIFEEAAGSEIFVNDPPEKLTRLFTRWIWGVLRGAIIYGDEDPKAEFQSLMNDLLERALKNDYDQNTK